MRLLFLERDIDKALRRMALEEEKNLTETVNDIFCLMPVCRKPFRNERAHFYIYVPMTAHFIGKMRIRSLKTDYRASQYR